MTFSAPNAADIRAAYRGCETITRQQAKNFAYGIALLPGDKRRALSAVYALARRIDDIGDGTLPAEEKLAALGEARVALTAVAAGTAADAAATGDPVLIALHDAASRFRIPLAAFGELIDGCEADVRGDQYDTFSQLEHYCRCVAGSIGRLSLGVFGSRDLRAEQLADALGVALQLTNILRDVREDLGNGRVYLPADDLARFGCALIPPGVEGGDGKIDGPVADLVAFEAERARAWYAVGMQLLPMLDWRSAACTGAMAGIYRRLLEHIAASPQQALAGRMSLRGREKALIALAAISGLSTRRPGRRTSEAQSSEAQP
ncbi:MAG TPA: presqualene diphosphate synthase HpnD [Streptosporangiaceae bacterium]